MMIVLGDDCNRLAANSPALLPARTTRPPEPRGSPADQPPELRQQRGLHQAQPPVGGGPSVCAMR